MKRVLVACETSGIVREAFRREGFDAWSCDVLPADDGSPHHRQADVRDVLYLEHWDALIAHPPCTRLCNSGVRWLHKAPPGKILAEMWRELDEGADLFSVCLNAPIKHKAIENPVMHKHAKERIRNYVPFAQSVQPWQFETDKEGPDNVKKRTCLWLEGLPKLQPTGTLDGTTARDEVHKASPGPDRWKQRSKFYPGIARAMAQQWGPVINKEVETCRN